VNYDENNEAETLELDEVEEEIEEKAEDTDNDEVHIEWAGFI
jgi:hypothetical protein